MTNILTIGLFTVVAITAADTPPLKITTQRDNDRVEVKADKDKAILRCWHRQHKILGVIEHGCAVG